MNSGGGLDGDKIVALMGLLMALALVSSGGTLRRLAPQKRLAFGLAWIAIFVGIAVVAGLLIGR